MPRAARRGRATSTFTRRSAGPSAPGPIPGLTVALAEIHYALAERARSVGQDPRAEYEACVEAATRALEIREGET